MLEKTLLGKEVDYNLKYSSDLLDPIARSFAREGLSLPSGFHGEDVWTSYEFSCLSLSGLPLIAIATFRFPHDSEYIVESKSFKLYLNSYNYEGFSSLEDARVRLESDLTNASGAKVLVRLDAMSDEQKLIEAPKGYHSIDQTYCSSEEFVYEPDSSLLVISQDQDIVEEDLFSDLLRSNCPVTGQPDWASVFLHYRGRKIDHEGLLRYVVSFRNCQDFHEHCVERTFSDVLSRCECEELSVYARYTRRGGLDINPYRSTSNLSASAPKFRTLRQ